MPMRLTHSASCERCWLRRAAVGRRRFSLVGALAASRTRGRLATYSISLGDHEYDESVYQDMVAKRYDLDHHRVVVGAKDYTEALPRAVRHMEDRHLMVDACS